MNSIKYCLKTAGITSEELDVLAIPSKSFQKEFNVFFDIPESIVPTKVFNFKQSIKNLIKKLVLKLKISFHSSTVLPIYQKPFKISKKCKIQLVEHHLAHIASGAYTSGIDITKKALGVTMDGIGDDTSVAIWRIQHNKIENLARFDGSGSLGWFYGNSTEAMGWRHGSEEWKVMGLAPYEKHKIGLLKGYHPEYRDGNLVKSHNFSKFGVWHDHGSFHYHGKDSLPLSKIFEKTKPEDFAAEVQRISEEQAFEIIIPWLKKEKTKHLVCAGGFFMNVKFNQNLWYKKVLDTQWIFPNPGDAGLSVGAALYVYYKNNPQLQHTQLDNLYLGPEYSNDENKKVLDDRAIAYEYFEDIEKETAKYLSKNLVVGWFQGRMEAGPRALGNRSILMSPLDPNNKNLINAKVKYREKFRPFCPSIVEESYEEYMVNPREELFMVSSFKTKEGIKKIIPAVVHEDNTVRPQKVKFDINPRYHKLITEFGEITGESVLLNTSFNIKGEPIICNPREAIKCFYDTGLDILVLGNYLVKKTNI